ncbi:MAG: methyltransferase domain-containing protein [Deltaproteobacteria bacterium]|nr:methyltransferase domain-containing protein [Deltaproteobacteria bacterium]MBW2386824.1 methyltransferase domain-containing protein [Deltaproteobacteria bacterium]MBW2723319.1 methyltransferase domain-containing protein [Deltaproteobacteria bacterium]
MRPRHFFALFLLLLALLTFATGCSTLGRMDLTRVVTSGRDGWQHPEQVVVALDLKPGDRVAEIGAGGGYWLPWLSQAVGAEGRVYAVEVDDALVAKLSERVSRDELQNVIVVRGQFEDPGLPDGEIDVAMTSNTYHHIDDRADYFRRLQDDLSSRGRVVHVDDRHDVPPPIRWLQSSGHWTEPASMRAEMTEAGYHKVEGFDFLPMQSFQIFVPIAEGS